MNALVCGKTPSENGFIFHSIESYDVNTVGLSKQLEEVDFDIKFLKLVTKQNKIIVFPLSNVMGTTESKTATKFMNPDNYNWIGFYRNGNNLFANTNNYNYMLSTVFNSIEIGTVD